ncbi:MAG: oligosaccharide flippase family protein [Verrucomicrobia bacterium]|nr:oligosaccharide flippase family protein [Verrucomicrobiota bacterium]
MSLKRQTVWNMLPLLAVSVVNIFSVPLFYRYLGAERSALLFDVQVLMGSFGFMDLGLGMAVGRYIGVALGRGDGQAIREYWATGNAIAIPLLAGMAAVFIGAGVWLGPKWYPVANAADVSLLRWSFAVGGVGLWLSYYAQFWNLLAQAHLDYKFISLLRVVISLGQILPAILIARLTANPLLVIAWTSLAGLLQLVVYIVHARGKYGLGLRFREANWARLREMASFTSKTFSLLVVNSVFGQIDRLVVGRLAPQVDFTHYTMAGNVAMRLQTVSSAASGPVYFHTSRAVGSGQGQPAQIYTAAFAMMVEWAGFAAVWIGVWSPVLLKLWLTLAHKPELAGMLSPFFTPLCVAFCFSAVAVVSHSQLGPLNRLGTELAFNLTLGLVVLAAVVVGWHIAGLQGVAYGFLASRVVLVGQDIYVARLIGAKSWLSLDVWRRMAIQAGIGGLFALTYLLLSRDSYWLLLAAALHAALASGWLLRAPLKNYFRKNISRSVPPNAPDGF